LVSKAAMVKVPDDKKFRGCYSLWMLNIHSRRGEQRKRCQQQQRSREFGSTWRLSVGWAG
jgi:hypothetical protein